MELFLRGKAAIYELFVELRVGLAGGIFFFLSFLNFVFCQCMLADCMFLNFVFPHFSKLCIFFPF